MAKGVKPDKMGNCPYCKSAKYHVVEFPRGIVWHCPHCGFTSMDPKSQTHYLELRRAWGKYCATHGNKPQ